MASYFVTRQARADGSHPVHDRSRCPPGRFPRDASEYLGDFLHAGQALVVARLRFARAVACACCDSAPVLHPEASQEVAPPMPGLRG